MSAEKNTSFGVTFSGLLFLVFLVLKLTGFIAWSWWWVTAPLWGPRAIALVVFLIVFGCMGVHQLLTSRNKKRRLQ